MKRQHLLCRVLLLALCVTQAAPSPAYALRAEQFSEANSGPEQLLKPAAGLEESPFKTALRDLMTAKEEITLDELAELGGHHGTIGFPAIFAAMRELGPAIPEPVGGFRSFFRVLDAQGKPTGRVAGFRRIHQQGYWHSVVSVMYRTPEGKFIFQLRGENGKRDTSAGGHHELAGGPDTIEDDTYNLLDTAVAESHEETGLLPPKGELVLVSNPVSGSGGLFRKDGGKDSPGGDSYDAEGVFHYQPVGSEGLHNREINTLAIRRMTGAEYRDFQARQGPTEEVAGFVEVSPEELWADLTGPRAELYSSTARQFFSDRRVFDHILRQFEASGAAGLEELAERLFSPYLREWVRPAVMEVVVGIRARARGDVRLDFGLEIESLLAPLKPLSAFEKYAGGVFSVLMLTDRYMLDGNDEMLALALEVLDGLRSRYSSEIEAPEAGYDRMMYHRLRGIILGFLFGASGDLRDAREALAEYESAIREHDAAGLPGDAGLLAQRARIAATLDVAERMAAITRAAMPSLRDMKEQRVRVTVFVERRVAPQATSSDLSEIAQALKEADNYPQVEITFLPEDPGARAFLLDEEEQWGVKVLNIRAYAGVPEPDGRTVYVNGLPEDGSGISVDVLPFLVSDAMARWWEFEKPDLGLLTIIVIGAAPYLNAGGLEESDFLDNILAGRFA